MIGIVIIGHGHLPSGFKSALEVIMGNQPHVYAVDFPSSDTATELNKNLENIYEVMREYDDVIIFADLLSGSPFNIAILKAMNDTAYHVFYGCNLGMLLDTAVKVSMEEPIATILEQIVATGKEQVGMFTCQTSEDDPFDD